MAYPPRTRGPERWDRDRFYSEFDRERDPYGERERFEEDERVYRGPPLRGPPVRLRERSVDDRFDRRFAPRDEEDLVIRDRRVVYDDEPRFRRRPSPPESEYDRRVVIEKERITSPSPPRRPGTLLRRQSSLDTFDRRPRFYEREEYGPPARRGDYRAPPYVPIPLPRHKALPPPRHHDPEFYDEIQVSDHHHFGDDEFHAYPERVREREIVRERRRNRSRESRHTSRHGSTVRSSSRSSTTTSTSSSSHATTTTAKSEYPKKGKTRIPQRLVSKRALIDLGYPFEEEGNTIVVQKALGQQNIDDLLKLSEDYKKSELEVAAARSSAGDVVEERREETVVVAESAPPPPPPASVAPPPAPTVITAPPPPPPAPPVEIVRERETVIRDVSPARSMRSYSTSTSATPVIIEARPREVREVSEEVAVGPMALVEHRHRRGSSRGPHDIRHEIRHLERELARRERHERHSDRELVRAERLSNGELVLYEEKIEKIQEPSRGVRIEKDKKGPPPKLMKAMLATLT